MTKTDANPPMPVFRDDYVLREVDGAWLSQAVKPKQFIHIDQSECIMCEGCVDICPWKCIFMVTPDAATSVAVVFMKPVSPARIMLDSKMAGDGCLTDTEVMKMNLPHPFFCMAGKQAWVRRTPLIMVSSTATG